MTKITIDRAIVEQALEALERYQVKRQDFDRFADEITALRAALAEPAQSGSCISCGNRMTGSPESFVVATAEVGVITPDGYSQQQVEALCSHKGGDVLSTPLSEPAQEPVAWMWEETAPRSSTGIGGIDRKLLFCRPADEPWNRNITPLYSAPPQQPVNLQDIEQYQLQMAGICTAALGYWTEDNSIHPDYDTPALRDVAKLYAKYAALYAAQSQRKPLTDEEIHDCFQQSGKTKAETRRLITRAIEKMHGIGDA